MTRKNSHHDDEPDAECLLCGCLECGCHNPFEGCCDAILNCIKACCRPVTNCIKSLCEGFAFAWFTFAWILEYLCTLGYNGMFVLIVVFAFTCLKTTFSCEKGKCTGYKDPIEDAWTPELIAKVVTAVACVFCLITSVYMLGIPAGYFDQPFDKSNLKIEHTLWVACQHMLKYMFLLPVQATGFNYKPADLDSSKYGDFGFMCYNNQVGNFLIGIDVEGMGQFGTFVFMVLFGILLAIFGMMSCTKKSSFLCMECTCFSPECYQVLCWIAIACIWIGSPLAIALGVYNFFMSFLSYNNAVLALMAAADFGYFLQWICAFAAPKGSYAHRMYLQQQKNLKTGKDASGSEKTPMTGGSKRPSGKRPIIRPSNRPSSGRIGGGRPSRPSGNGPTKRDKRGVYKQARNDDAPDYDDDVYETRDMNVDRYVDDDERDVEEPCGDDPCESGDAGGGIDMDGAIEAVDGIMDKVEEYAPKIQNAMKQYNKHNPEDEEEGDQEEPNEDDGQGGGDEDQAADEAGGDEEAGNMFGME